MGDFSSGIKLAVVLSKHAVQVRMVSRNRVTSLEVADKSRRVLARHHGIYLNIRVKKALRSSDLFNLVVLLANIKVVVWADIF